MLWQTIAEAVLTTTFSHLDMRLADALMRQTITRL